MKSTPLVGDAPNDDYASDVVMLPTEEEMRAGLRCIGGNADGQTRASRVKWRVGDGPWHDEFDHDEYALGRVCGEWCWCLVEEDPYDKGLTETVDAVLDTHVSLGVKLEGARLALREIQDLATPEEMLKRLAASSPFEALGGLIGTIQGVATIAVARIERADG